MNNENSNSMLFENNNYSNEVIFVTTESRQKSTKLETVYELMTKISKLMIQESISGCSNINTEFYIFNLCENSRKLCLVSNKLSNNHKMPFIFKIIKQFPNFARPGILNVNE